MTQYPRQRGPSGPVTRRGVLLDTGPIYGLLDARDQYHAEALGLFDRLEAEGTPVNAAYPALLEAHRLLLTRPGSGVERAYTRIFGVFDLAAVQYPVAADGNSARATLERFSDQRISLTDATIAAMAVRLNLQAVTFDRRHFGLMGAEVLE